MRFILSEEAIVDKYANKVIADSFMNQQRGYGRIDSSAQTQDDLFITCGFSYFSNGIFREGFHGPVGFAWADMKKKIFNHFSALGGMLNLRVKLNRE